MELVFIDAGWGQAVKEMIALDKSLEEQGKVVPLARYLRIVMILN